ncbi:MAG: hypothetical protein QF733_09190 [Phycisphaerales bacterium]|jgi:hypothetical protein|nr:hypothetical protein [Phycisphaerales bacterium]
MSDQQDTPVTMSAADAAALDHLATDGFDPAIAGELEGDMKRRGEAASSLLSLLDQYPADDLSDEDQQTLVDATMARIRRAEDDRRDRMRMDNHPVMMGRGLRFRIAEALAVAAVLAMATATIWSFGTTARDRAMSAGARSNLGELHAGLSAFQDSSGDTPLKDADASVEQLLSGGPAKMIDLQIVAAQDFCDPRCMRNPRRPGAGRGGFSFAVLAEGHEPHLAHGQVILAGDRNPALAGLIAGKDYESSMEDIRWHPRLVERPSVLYSDGHTEDLSAAHVGGDRIWGVEPEEGPAPIELFLAH